MIKNSVLSSVIRFKWTKRRSQILSHWADMFTPVTFDAKTSG